MARLQIISILAVPGVGRRSGVYEISLRSESTRVSMSTQSKAAGFVRNRLRVVVTVLALALIGFLLRDFFFDNDHFHAASCVLSPESFGWAGIGWDAASPADIATMGVPYALRLTEVAPTGPADIAGLSSGDFVTSINGSTFGDAAEFQAKTSAFRPGQTVTLGVVRNGTPITVSVKLDKWYDVKNLDIGVMGL